MSRIFNAFSTPTIRHDTHFQFVPDLPCVRFAALYSFFSSIFYHFSVRLLFLVNESCGFECHTKYERLLFRMAVAWISIPFPRFISP